MDEELKNKGSAPVKGASSVDNEKRLEMYRKLRKDMELENREEKEAAFKKRAEELDKKDKQGVVTDDGDDFLKGIKTYGTNE